MTDLTPEHETTRPSSLAYLHTVNRSGMTHTFRSTPGGSRVKVTVFCAAFGTIFLVLPVLDLFDRRQGVGAGWVLGSIGLWLVFVFAAYRSYCQGAQVRGGKLIIHQELWTRKIWASDIRAITLKPGHAHSGGADTPRPWRPRVELADGRRIWIECLDCGPTTKPPQPERAAAVGELRTLLGIGADPETLPEASDLS